MRPSVSRLSGCGQCAAFWAENENAAAFIPDGDGDGIHSGTSEGMAIICEGRQTDMRKIAHHDSRFKGNRQHFALDKRLEVGLKEQSPPTRQRTPKGPQQGSEG
jgi:hypothetical protein